MIFTRHKFIVGFAVVVLAARLLLTWCGDALVRVANESMAAASSPLSAGPEVVAGWVCAFVSIALLFVAQCAIIGGPAIVVIGIGLCVDRVLREVVE